MNIALDSVEMTDEVRQAYEWAKRQKHQRHARVLAEYIEQTELCVKNWNKVRLKDKLEFLRFNND